MRLVVAALSIVGLGLVGARASQWQSADRTTTHFPETRHVEDDRLYLDGAGSSRESGLKGTPTPIRSLLNVKQRMHYGDYIWNEQKIPQGIVWIRVDLKSQLLSVFRAGHEIGTAVILYGATAKETPLGVFPILAKMSKHRSSSYDAEMPYTLRLTDDGISIHASNVRWGLATHGCIGVPPVFAKKLFEQVTRGDKVVIVSSDRLA